jgi:hypothetical protein
MFKVWHSCQFWKLSFAGAGMLPQTWEDPAERSAAFPDAGVLLMSSQLPSAAVIQCTRRG